jgi:hypothetical protein
LLAANPVVTMPWPAMLVTAASGVYVTVWDEMPLDVEPLGDPRTIVNVNELAFHAMVDALEPEPMNVRELLTYELVPRSSDPNRNVHEVDVTVSTSLPVLPELFEIRTVTLLFDAIDWLFELFDQLEHRVPTARRFENVIVTVSSSCTWPFALVMEIAVTVGCRSTVKRTGALVPVFVGALVQSDWLAQAE